MRIKTPPFYSDPLNKTDVNTASHIQALTDDVHNILAGGLSMADGQLPFQIKKLQVYSGQPVSLAMQRGFSIIGCLPIFSGGARILGFSTNLTSNGFTITLTLDTANPVFISFLLIGTSQ